MAAVRWPRRGLCSFERLVDDRGCTELPLVVDDANACLPTLD